MSRCRKAIRGGGELTARGVAKVAFVGVLFVFAVVAVSASAPLALTILAMFIVYIMVRTILPAETITEWMQAFWRGEPFVTIWNRLWGLIE